jgi:ABC-type glycerol-3-phosphate transport system permease component
MRVELFCFACGQYDRVLLQKYGHSGSDLGTTIRNSMIITLGTVVGIWIIAGLAAYAMTHLDLPGKKGPSIASLISNCLRGCTFP